MSHLNKNFIILTFLFFGTILTVFTPNQSVYSSSRSSLHLGTFSISNTTSSQRLGEFEASDKIGATWNLSLSLHANSTSWVNFQFGATNNKWEGPTEFQISPNGTLNTFSTLYIQHLVSDSLGSWWLDYSLDESSKQANGIYSVKKIHNGYTVDYGTGDYYVSDISKWLEERSQSKPISTTTSNTTSIHLFPLFLSVFIIFRRRRKL